MNAKSNLLFAFHRRFLLRGKLGRSWRASLSALATQQGLFLHANSLSHIVAGDWHSRDFSFERLIAEALDVCFAQIWPEYAGLKEARGRDASRPSENVRSKADGHG